MCKQINFDNKNPKNMKLLLKIVFYIGIFKDKDGAIALPIK